MLSSFIGLFLDFVMIAMFGRAILSLIFMDDDNKFIQFLYFVTEPFIQPVRALMEKWNILQGTPMDFSFIITYLLLYLLSLLFV